MHTNMTNIIRRDYDKIRHMLARHFCQFCLISINIHINGSWSKLNILKKDINFYRKCKEISLQITIYEALEVVFSQLLGGYMYKIRLNPSKHLNIIYILNKQH